MRILLSLLVTMMSASAMAAVNCAVVEKDSNGQYTKVLAEKALEGENAALLFERGNDAFIAMATSEWIQVALVDKSSKEIVGSAVGDGRRTIMVLPGKGLAAMCVRQQ